MSKDIRFETQQPHGRHLTNLIEGDTGMALYAQSSKARDDVRMRNEASSTSGVGERRRPASALTTSILPLAAGQPALNANAPPELLRQMRARLAFQRASTRLYEALLDKLDAAADTALRSQRGSLNRNTLLRFRNEEAAHFEMLCESLECMGVDPVTDLGRESDHGCAMMPPRPKTDVMNAAEALKVLLDIEQTDEAGWQHLVATAHDCGLNDLAHRFEQAHSEEIGHVRQLRAWTIMLPAGQRRVA